MKNSIMTIFSLALLTLCVLIGPVWSNCLNGALQITSDSPGFTVTYYGSYKVVNNTRANETYVLYCSSQPPNDENVPQNVKGFFQIPLKNVASFDRTTLTFLELLGVQSSLSYVADKNSITSPCLQSNDTIQTFSDSNLVNVDAIFTTSTPVSGSKYVTISLGNDLTPLSNAEWIKFVSLFYDLEANATSIYSTIETTYECTVQNLGGVKEDNRNVIAWVSYNFTDSIFTISAAKFHYSLMQQGGGAKTTTETLFANSTRSLKRLLRPVDFVIDETQFINSSDTFENWQRTFGYDDTSDLPKFITLRQVYRPRKLLNSYGYDDWSEKSYARPDIALLDLIAMQYPTYLPSYTKTWLNNFSASDEPIIITSANCTDKNVTTPSFIQCTSQIFTGNSNDNDNNNNNSEINDDVENSKNRKSAIIIIVCSILAGLAGFGLGTWLLLWARKRYGERFIELKDEPEVQAGQVDEEKGNNGGTTN